MFDMLRFVDPSMERLRKNESSGRNEEIQLDHRRALQQRRDSSAFGYESKHNN